MLRKSYYGGIARVESGNDGKNNDILPWLPIVTFNYKHAFLSTDTASLKSAAVQSGFFSSLSDCIFATDITVIKHRPQEHIQLLKEKGNENLRKKL